MNYEKDHSYIYKELHPNYWNALLTNPTLYESIGLILCGLFLGALITVGVVIGH